MTTKLDELKALANSPYHVHTIGRADLRALIAIAEALKNVLSLDDGDVPMFWGDRETEIMDNARAALAALGGTTIKAREHAAPAAPASTLPLSGHSRPMEAADKVNSLRHSLRALVEDDEVHYVNKLCDQALRAIELETDLRLNESMLAKQCDMAREAESALVALRRGEFICAKCGLRKDGEYERGNF